jgi:hypothetical protein
LWNWKLDDSGIVEGSSDSRPDESWMERRPKKLRSKSCNAKAAMKSAKSKFELLARMVTTPIESSSTKMVNTIFLSRGEFAAPNYSVARHVMRGKA